MGSSLISLNLKKQNSIALSTVEAEYIESVRVAHKYYRLHNNFQILELISRAYQLSVTVQVQFA